MKNTLLIFILFCNFFAFSQKSSKKSFEGIITYQTTLSFRNELSKASSSLIRNYLKEKYGSELLVYYNKQGDIRRTYLNTGDKGFDFHLYIQSENNYYAKWKNIDTLYYYNTSENSLKKLSLSEGKSIKIHGQKCRYIKIKGIDPIGNQTVIQTFHYGKKPYLNPRLFTGFQDFFTSEILSKSKSPFMKLELDMGDFTITYSKIKIEQKALEGDIFTLPVGVPIKK